MVKFIGKSRNKFFRIRGVLDFIFCGIIKVIKIIRKNSMEETPIQLSQEKMRMIEPETRDLRLYVVVGRKLFYDIPDEKAVLIFSYDLDGVGEKVKMLVPPNTNMKMLGCVKAKELFDLVDTNGSTVVGITPPLPEPAVQDNKEELSLEQFKARLMLALDRYCPEEEISNLKAIIGKLRVKVAI